MSELPEQVYRLGERVEFHCYDNCWKEGIVYEAKLMGDMSWISYGCLADDGFSLDRLEPDRLRPISAVKLLGSLAGEVSADP